jgi:CubicO group peptidase (beta-lactamase class C family)
VSGAIRVSFQRKEQIMKMSLYRTLVMSVFTCLLMLLASPFTTLSVAAASPVGSLDVARIHAFMSSEIQANRIPGLALGLVHGTQIVSLQSYGEASQGRPVTPQTPFLLASLTKSFTALAMMQLVEAGKVALDAPVQRYLPWFRLADPAASAQITVRQLLNMTSGLPAVSPGITATETTEQFVRSLSAVALDRSVGSSFEYAPSGYVILGLIVQTVSGQAYPTYMQRHIFAPLQMNHSFASLQAAQQNGLAQGHEWLFGVPVPTDDIDLHLPAVLSAGGLFSSVEDMSHYLIAQTNNGRYGDAAVLSPSGIVAMHAPAVPNPTTGPPFGPGTAYGMGWHIGPIAGVPTIWHDGVTSAYHSLMLIEPQNSWGAILLVNADTTIPSTGNGNTFFYEFYAGLARLLAGEEPPAAGLSLSTFYFLADGFIILISVLVPWSLLRLPRWYKRFGQRPHSRRVIVPLVRELLLPLVLFFGLPFVVGSWSDLLFSYPDLGWWLLVTLACLLLTGIIRGVLAFLVLRRKDASTRLASPSPYLT